MKEIVYKNILGTNPRKKEVSFEETVNVDINQERMEILFPLKISKKWLCKYFVEESYTSVDKVELKKWVDIQKKSGVRKDCHVLRNCDERTGENKIVCKVLGDFFLINGNVAYKIVYVNELKVEIAKNSQKNRRF